MQNPIVFKAAILSTLVQCSLSRVCVWVWMVENRSRALLCDFNWKICFLFHRRYTTTTITVTSSRLHAFSQTNFCEKIPFRRLCRTRVRIKWTELVRFGCGVFCVNWESEPRVTDNIELDTRSSYYEFYWRRTRRNNSLFDEFIDRPTKPILRLDVIQIDSDLTFGAAAANSLT